MLVRLTAITDTRRRLIMATRHHARIPMAATHHIVTTTAHAIPTHIVTHLITGIPMITSFTMAITTAQASMEDSVPNHQQLIHFAGSTLSEEQIQHARLLFRKLRLPSNSRLLSEWEFVYAGVVTAAQLGADCKIPTRNTEHVNRRELRRVLDASTKTGVLTERPRAGRNVRRTFAKGPAWRE